jgi:hypothetical protein
MDIKNSGQVVVDSKGDLHPYRLISLKELLWLEKRFSGNLQYNADKVRFEDMVYIVVTCCSMTEDQVVEKFDVESLAKAFTKIMLNGWQKGKTGRTGSRDDQE